MNKVLSVVLRSLPLVASHACVAVAALNYQRLNLCGAGETAPSDQMLYVASWLAAALVSAFGGSLAGSTKQALQALMSHVMAGLIEAAVEKAKTKTKVAEAAEKGVSK